MPESGEHGYELVYGLWVEDPAVYAQYRRAMKPILEAMGGRFRYDFEIARTLHAESEAPINRVFVLSFPSRQVHDAFFADPAYQRAREQYFERAVKSVTRLA